MSALLMMVAVLATHPVPLPPCELSPDGTCIYRTFPRMGPCGILDDESARWVRQAANCMRKQPRDDDAD